MTMEQHAVGQEKVSVTITRKTKGDLLVTQQSLERWFVAEQAAVDATRRVTDVFAEPADGDG
jgi:hypothetical protein